jgi:predicted nucleic acid-binding protein
MDEKSILALLLLFDGSELTLKEPQKALNEFQETQIMMEKQFKLNKEKIQKLLETTATLIDLVDKVTIESMHLSHL